MSWLMSDEEKEEMLALYGDIYELEKPKAGGHRPGSGRPKGWGPYGEPTKCLRVPFSMLLQVEELLEERKAKVLSEKLKYSPGNNVGESDVE